MVLGLKYGKNKIKFDEVCDKFLDEFKKEKMNHISVMNY